MENMLNKFGYKTTERGTKPLNWLGTEKLGLILVYR